MANQMTGTLAGKVALITGGTTGIGRDTAVLFAKEGAKVVISGRRETEGEETVRLIKKTGGRRAVRPGRCQPGDGLTRAR